MVWQKLSQLLKYCSYFPALHVSVQENQQQKVARLYNLIYIFNCMCSDKSKTTGLETLATCWTACWDTRVSLNYATLRTCSTACLHSYLPNFLLGKVFQQLAAKMRDKHCQRHTDLGTSAATALVVSRNNSILALFGRFGLVSFLWHVSFGRFGLVDLIL